LTLTKKISHTAFEISIHSLGFYQIIIPENTLFTIKDFQRLLAAQKELGEIKTPSLVLAHESSSLEAEAFKTVSKKLSNPYSTADAFVIKSMAQRIIGNFYLKVSKPERPTRFFNNKDEAISWLKNYL
jgi:hypothetical protein